MQKYTMEDFIKKPIAVRTGIGNKERKFLEMCADEGLRWHSGSAATKLVPKQYGDGTCISCDDGELTFCDDDWYSACEYKVIDFDEFISDVNNGFPEIRIRTDGKTTTAEMVRGGKVVKTAEANCNPADKFRFDVGVNLALERLFGKKESGKQEYTEVKREANVGEYVRLVTNGGYAGDFYYGDICLVRGVSDSGCARLKPKRSCGSRSDGCLNFLPCEYVILEGYKGPEKRT